MTHTDKIRTAGESLRDSTRLFIRGRGAPPDVLKEASKRLSILAFVISIIVFLNIVLFVLVPMFGGPRVVELPRWLDAMIVAMFGASVALFWVARSERIPEQRKLDLGLVFEVFFAYLLVVPLRIDSSSILYLPQHGASENVILILLFPVIVPNKAWKIGLASLLVALADPVSVWLAGMRGIPLPPLPELVAAFYWNFICAPLAVVISEVVNGLGRHVAEAREMGSYRLREKLGEGGMGEVWRADHRLLQREAAVKLIRPEILDIDGAEAEKVMGRFEREAQATAALHSPHSIDLYDFGITDDGTFYYVMELLDGIDLESLVKRFGPLPSERVTFLLAQACHSLADAHEGGLVHRDVKPANLFACRMGRDADFVKVLDFGLVKWRREDLSDDPLQTDARTLRGTPAYMPPEMVRGDDVDGRADLYALGCVGYWLLTGRLVFEGKKAMEMMVRHAQEDPESPSSFTELPVHPDLERVLLWCLQKKAEDRPSSAEELASVLASIPFEIPWAQARARRWWETHLPKG